MFSLYYSLYFLSRYGGANHCLTDLNVKMEEWCLRGGWKLGTNGECYIGDIKFSVSVAGRSLSGWRNPRASCFQPSCDAFINPENREKVENFISTLFVGAIYEMGKDRKLWNLSKCCFASLLMYLNETRSKFPKLSVLSEVVYKAGLCDINMSDMLNWGDLVKAKFKLDNQSSLLDDRISVF